MLGRLILDLEGTQMSLHEEGLLQSPHVGGIIFFSRNYESPEQLHQLIRHIRSVRPDILLTLDQEGGRVQRFIKGFSRLPGLQQIGDLIDTQGLAVAQQSAWHIGWLMAAELLSVGIDCSFAPVVDLHNSRCPAIAGRAFSQVPEQVIKLASHYIAGMQSAGMAATLKHFPGHGVVDSDSHIELPVSELTLADLEASALKPFQQLASSCQAIMAGHLLFPQIDNSNVGYSSFWLRSVLRQRIGFRGLIISDDLSMKGAEGSDSYQQRATKALNAGCDLILVCNNPAMAAALLRYLEQTPMEADKELALRFDAMRGRWPDSQSLHTLEVFQKAQSYLDNVSSSSI